MAQDDLDTLLNSGRSSPLMLLRLKRFAARNIRVIKQGDKLKNERYMSAA
jgi:hypothetical protein